MLRDGEFDLVFACAALHHTLKYPGALAELARVMRPGARLVLAETWGGNPLLNAARQIRARAAGEAEEQGEGIIFSRRELHDMDPFFEGLHVEHLNLLAMGKRVLRRAVSAAPGGPGWWLMLSNRSTPACCAIAAAAAQLVRRGGDRRPPAFDVTNRSILALHKRRGHAARLHR